MNERNPRRILVCAGGRHLHLDRINPKIREALENLREAVRAWAPTHVIHGNQRGGDLIWHEAIRAYGHPRAVSIPCQEIRVSPTRLRTR